MLTEVLTFKRITRFMQIYLGRGGKQAGPYTQDELNQMLRDEQVELTDLFWSQGMSEWRALSEVTGGSHYWDGINRTMAPSMTAQTSGALLEDRPVEVKDLSPFDNSEPAKADATAHTNTEPKVSPNLKTDSVAYLKPDVWFWLSQPILHSPTLNL